MPHVLRTYQQETREFAVSQRRMAPDREVVRARLRALGFDEVRFALSPGGRRRGGVARLAGRRSARRHGVDGAHRRQARRPRARPARHAPGDHPWGDLLGWGRGQESGARSQESRAGGRGQRPARGRKPDGGGRREGAKERRGPEGQRTEGGAAGVGIGTGAGVRSQESGARSRRSEVRGWRPEAGSRTAEDEGGGRSGGSDGDAIQNPKSKFQNPESSLGSLRVARGLSRHPEARARGRRAGVGGSRGRRTGGLPVYADTGPVLERGWADGRDSGFSARTRCSSPPARQLAPALGHPDGAGIRARRTSCASNPGAAGPRRRRPAVRPVHALPDACPTRAFAAPGSRGRAPVHFLPDD